MGLYRDVTGFVSWFLMNFDRLLGQLRLCMVKTSVIVNFNKSLHNSYNNFQLPTGML